KRRADRGARGVFYADEALQATALTALAGNASLRRGKSLNRFVGRRKLTPLPVGPNSREHPSRTDRLAGQIDGSRALRPEVPPSCVALPPSPLRHPSHG